METEEEARSDGGQAARRGEASPTVTGISRFSSLGGLGTVLYFISSLNTMLLLFF